MLDTIAYSPCHPGSAALATVLGPRLHLGPVPLSRASPPDSALLVAPASERHHRDAAMPVLALTKRAQRRNATSGRSILCGIQDDADAPTAAIAGVLAEALALPLILMHVVPPVAVAVSGTAIRTVAAGLCSEDHELASATLVAVAGDAGLECSGAVTFHVATGAPGPELVAGAREHDAAFLVVSRSIRSRWVRWLQGSAPVHLLRHCDRPLLVCPRSPSAAMRLREAVRDARHESGLPDP